MISLILQNKTKEKGDITTIGNTPLIINTYNRAYEERLFNSRSLTASYSDS